MSRGRHRPGYDGRARCSKRRCAPCSACHSAVQPRRLAWLHPRIPDERGGDCGGVAVYSMLRSLPAASTKGRRCCATSRGSAFSSACSSTSPGGCARRLERLLGTRRLQPQLQLLVCAALIAGFAPVYARGIAIEGSARTAFDFVFADRLGRRDRLRLGCGLSGQVSSPRGARAARRRRARDLHQLRLALCARSRADPTGRGDRHDGAASARAALAAEADPQARPRRRRMHSMVSRPRLRHRGRCGVGTGGAFLCGHDPPAAATTSRASLSRTPIPRAAAPTS